MSLGEPRFIDIFPLRGYLHTCIYCRQFPVKPGRFSCIRVFRNVVEKSRSYKAWPYYRKWKTKQSVAPVKATVELQECPTFFLLHANVSLLSSRSE